jgi:EmrB/QacA subfamily drug resistance transporter
VLVSAEPSISATTAGTPTPHDRRWLIFGVVAVALFMSSVDSTIVSTALPDIHRSLRASINWAGWSITIYSLGMVVVLPIAGKVSDQFGRRRVFFFGIAVFTLTSIACGLAPNIYVLVAFRAIQALGGGAFTPSAAGIIADSFGGARDRAIGMFGSIAGAGQIVGPVLGGVIVGYLSWRWIFFVNVPTGLVLLVLVRRFIPESARRAGGKVDLRGLSYMIAFVLVAMFAITDLGSGHTTADDPSVVVPGAIALALLYVFFHHARTFAEPFIPLRLLLGRGFAVMNIENLLWGVVGFGVSTLVPLYARDRYHLAALNSGTLLTARAIGMIAIGGAATFALRRTGYRPPLFLGFSLVAAGVLVMSVAPRFGLGPYLWLSVGAGLTGLGNGAANPATRNACLQLEPESVAAITGLRLCFIYVGMIFSVTIATSILNRSATPGLAQAHIMWVVAGIIAVVMMPLILRIPEHKGSW